MGAKSTSVKTIIGKTCAGCGNDTPLDGFKVQKNGFLGRTSRCKKCIVIDTANYRLTEIGVISTMYAAQLMSSRRRKHPRPNYSCNELKDWLLAKTNFRELYRGWVESGYDTKLKPSCDRLDDYIPYQISNLRVVTWRENYERSHRDRKNGINRKQSYEIEMIDPKTGVVVSRFYSSAQAQRETGANQGHIRECCKGVRQTCNGFAWRNSEAESIPSTK
jgi:hypothetical protein